MTAAPSYQPDCCPKKMRVLGIPVSIVDLGKAVDLVADAAKMAGHHLVLVREVPSLMLASKDRPLCDIHDDALLVVPDGMPLVWLGRLRGFGSGIGRVAGADLLDAVCARSTTTGQSHYFYGGKPGVALEMSRRLSERYPGLRVAGCYSPPMRSLDQSFVPDTDILAELEVIRASNADFVWVGLSSPKQEFWMTSCAAEVGRGVFFGVGAAFDFHAGTVRRAPLWMQRSGLEWLHRLVSEPRRLWRRYILLAPAFVLAVFREELSQYIHRWLIAK